ncbi:hypothetical protein IFM89_014251 [Coptis chinensis]|uniref:Uncharacterized protein n=1 Tax=Coptis chinensis TaxID=261450 RepID=A0A835IMW9_9MAGN|nr:hypothetical protein IFM89_014251 [Coptis chinensis]
MSPSLLCPENSNVCFDDEIGNGFLEEQWNPHKLDKKINFFHSGDFFQLGNLPLQSEECMSLIVEKECDFLPRSDYLKRLQNGDLDLMVRKDALDWMKKVHSYYSFGPLTAYLSISYFDRFLSNYELPSGRAWVVQLLAVACLSLAAKMEEAVMPLSLDLQVIQMYIGHMVGEPRFVFEARTIQRMELVVLSTLKWRMQAVTPFSFIDYFLHKINDDRPPLKLFISQSAELTLCLANGIEFLEYKPSEVAAAVTLSVLGESQIVNFDKAVSCFIQLVQKERVLKCLKLVQGFSPISGSVYVACAFHPSTPQSPIGVLDASCLSYKSEELTAGSGPISSCACPDAKRRKLNDTSELDLK